MMMSMFSRHMKITLILPMMLNRVTRGYAMTPKSKRVSYVDMPPQDAMYAASSALARVELLRFTRATASWRAS